MSKVYTSAVVIIPPEKMGTANASFSFAYGAGCIVGPLVTGWVLELFSIEYLPKLKKRQNLNINKTPKHLFF